VIRSRRLLSFSFVVLAGCTDVGEPTFEEIEDVGALCILGGSDDDEDYENTSYVENEPVTIHVFLDTIGGLASPEVMESCSVEQDGSTLHVSASASWWNAAPGVATPSSFKFVKAACTSEPLAAGTYTVEYGDATTTIEVPSMGPPAQIGTYELASYKCGT
jgi:hypothetical protein